MAVEGSAVLYPGGQVPPGDGNRSTRQVAPAAGGFLGGRAAAQLLPFRVTPDLMIAVGALVKKAGQREGQNVELVISEESDPAEMGAYEELLFDAMRGNSARFARQDYVEEAWRIVDPVLGDVVPVYEYEPGTWGPSEVSAFNGPDGGWFAPSSRQS